jgi:hypothetical protein
MKKAMELSVLCDCQIAVIVFSGDKLYQYSSSDLYGMMQRVMTHEGPYESATNADVTKLLQRNAGCLSLLISFSFSRNQLKIPMVLL